VARLESPRPSMPRTIPLTHLLVFLYYLLLSYALTPIGHLIVLRWIDASGALRSTVDRTLRLKVPAGVAIPVVEAGAL
jgi:hypothetical protein